MRVMMRKASGVEAAAHPATELISTAARNRPPKSRMKHAAGTPPACITGIPGLPLSLPLLPRDGGFPTEEPWRLHRTAHQNRI